MNSKKTTSGNDTPAKETARYHLSTNAFEERVSNFEHAMMCMMEAYFRYNRQALVTSAHDASVNAQDLIILNSIHMHDRPKNIAEVCRFLNRDDIVNVQYSVRKMVKIGLIERASSAKTRTASYRTTQEGRRKIDQFVTWRRELLLSAVEALGPEIEQRLEDAGQLIWLMSGLYDQAARILSTRE